MTGTGRKLWQVRGLSFLLWGLLFWVKMSAIWAQQPSMDMRGVPWMDHYRESQHLRWGKIWGIRSAPNGMVYMAAEKGLLAFDGTHWNRYPGSAGFTRSILVANDSTIYTGSDLDFGIWTRIAGNAFTYRSLYPYRNTVKAKSEEFWHTLSINNTIFFVSAEQVYGWRDGQLTQLAAPAAVTGCFPLENSFYLATTAGIYRWEANTLVLVAAFTQPKDIRVAGIYRRNNVLQVITEQHGLFSIVNGNMVADNSALSQKLMAEKAFCTTMLPSDRVAIGTVLNGLYVVGRDGRIVMHLNKEKGLPNNTLLSAHYAGNGRLWLGLDYGISAVDIASNLTYVLDYLGQFGTGYAAHLQQDQFWLGTNQGVYSIPWQQLDGANSRPAFSLLAGSAGQVWTLKEVNGQLLVGHDRGLFTIQNNRMEQLGAEPGVWTMVQAGSNRLLTGHYNGIGIFTYQGNRWVYEGKMKDIAGSCSQLLVQGDTVVWAGIPNFGLVRARVGSNWQPISRDIFPDSLFGKASLHMYLGAGNLFVTGDNQTYRYSVAEKRFETVPTRQQVTGVKGLLHPTDTATRLNEFFSFYPVYNGFALLNHYIQPPKDRLIQAPIVRGLLAYNSDTMVPVPEGHRIPYYLNNLRVQMLIPGHPDLLWQYRIEGQDNGWSGWQQDPDLTLLDLQEGRYTLEIRAKQHDAISPSYKLAFAVSPPWYRSILAYLMYAGLLVAGIWGIRQRMRYRLRLQKLDLLRTQQKTLQEQAEKHRHQVMLLEQKQLLLEKEQLSQQLKSKTIELAGKAKDNADKTHLLEKIKQTFEEGLANPAKAKLKWAELQRLLDTHLEESDKTFEIQMDELHQDFFKTLKEKFPGLSVYDLRLCAYVKIGLNTLEIAEMLKVLPSSVYISRSRLRKKLGLTADDDLHGFLNRLK